MCNIWRKFSNKKVKLLNTYIQRKAIDNGEIKKSLDDYIPTEGKLLSLSVELVNKINKDVPEYSGEVPKKKYKKFVTPRVSVDDIIEADAQKDINFVAKVNTIAKVAFPSGKITLDESEDTFKKLIESKRDFLGMTKVFMWCLPDFVKMKMVTIFNSMVWGDRKEDVKEHALGKGSLVYKDAKNGPLDKLSSYRMIIAIPNCVNHFHRVLSMRLLNHFMINNHIFDCNINKGSLPIKNSILEQITKVREVTRTKTNDNCHMMFVDLTNAFPSMNLKNLASLLREYDVDSSIIEYIQEFYKNLEYSVRISRSENTPLKKWNQGLIQGCPMSPILFVIVMNYILDRLNKKYCDTYGFILHGQPILFTVYVDDICIITKDSEGLKIVFDELKSNLSEFGLEINMSKTKVMSKYTKTVSEIENVDSYKYLGEQIDFDYSLNVSYKNIYKVLFKKLYRIDKASYGNDNKASVFNSMVLPWLRRKLAAFYDLEESQISNLRKVMSYFLTKWDVASTNVVLQNSPGKPSRIRKTRIL